MSSQAKKRGSDAPPEQSPVTLSPQQQQQQQRELHRTLEDENEEKEDTKKPSTTSGVTTPSVLISPPTSPSLTKPRDKVRHNTTNDATMDNGTKVLISQIVATDMARQDYKEKVIAVTSGGTATNTAPHHHHHHHTTTHAAPLSPSLSPRSLVVMKQRPPPPHRIHSSSQHSHLSATSLHSGTTGSTSAHRRSHPPPPSSSSLSTRSPTLSPTAARLSLTTGSWNPPHSPDAAQCTPSPSQQRNRVYQVSHHQLLHHSPPDLSTVSPPPPVGATQYPRASFKEPHHAHTSPSSLSSMGRLGISARSATTIAVTPPSPRPKEITPGFVASTPQEITPGFVASRRRDGDDAADHILQEAKRREREQGPTIMSSSAATMRLPLKKKAPPVRVDDDEDGDRKRHARAERDSAMRAMYDDHRQPSAVSASRLATARPRSSTTVTVSMKKAPAESRIEWKPTTVSSNKDAAVSDKVPRGPRPDTMYSHAASSSKPQTDIPPFSTTTALDVARDDLEKRRERERGPSLFSAMVTPRQRHSSRATNPKIASHPMDASIIGAASASKDDDMNAIKRRERDSGPALASATGSFSRRRTTTPKPPPPSTTSRTEDFMGDAKRQEKDRHVGRVTIARAPAYVRSTPPRGSDVSSNLPSKPNKSSKHDTGRVIFDVDEDYLSNDDTAYALAMARTNLERKMLQESTATSRDPSMKGNGAPMAHRTGSDQEVSNDDSAYALAMARSNLERKMVQESGTSRHSAMESAAANRTGSGREMHPGAAASFGLERNVKSDTADPGPSIAPAVGRVSPRVSPRSPSRFNSGSHWANADIEAQAGMPLMTPGAFAVHGVSNPESDYTSSERSDDDYHSVTDPVFDNVDGTFAPDAPLEAEVYDQVVLDGAVVTTSDIDEEIVDPKVLKRLRFVQISILVFALCAIGVIIGSIIGFAPSDNISGPPTVQGWNQSGVVIFGPTEEPQTLFGSSIAMSGYGNRIAVASPGADKESVLDVGQVYIMEAEQKRNGTSWKTLDVLVGPGPSNAAQTSIAMTPDSKWLAVGYARHRNGSQVQLYQEIDGLWQPELSPIIDKNGTDAAWFGYALDISSDGTIVAVGAPQMNSPNGDGSGAVQVFQRSGDGSWIEMGSPIYGWTAREFFGWTVSFATSSTNGRLRLAAGSPVSNDTTGVVRVFDWDSTEWFQVGTDLVGDVPLNRFGESIAMSDDGSILAVGIRGSAFEAGQAKVYRDINGDWKLDDMSFLGTEPGDGFGASIALSGDGNVLAIGGPQSNLFGDRAGIVSVYEYDPSTGSWKQKGSSIGSSNITEFGMSIALSNDGQRVVGGAPTTSFDGNIARVGSVLAFDSTETQ